jgi:hypothetical protein
MPEPNLNPQPKHPRLVSRLLSSIRIHLQKEGGRRGHGIHHHFMQGVAYKLGSGAVTLLILWWEARH